MLVCLPLLPNLKLFLPNLNIPVIHIPSPFWALITIFPFLPHFHPFWVLTYIHTPYSILPRHPLTLLLKIKKRHTSLNSFQCSSSIHSPPHLPSCTHTMANGSKLDAKEKENKAKNPQKSKDQHVPSK